MELVDKNLILKQFPIFADLPEDKLAMIGERSLIAEYKKGQVIYEEGAPADAFYCVILGRVLVYTKDKFGNQTVLEHLYRGKYFGIISLLTNGSHSVSAKAINDSVLLVIRRQDFDFILKQAPQLAIDLSQTLSRRLKDKSLHQKTIFESVIISVFSSYSQAGKSVYALNLGLSLHKEAHKSVIILDIAADDAANSLPVKLGLGDNHKVLGLSSISLDSPGAVKDFLNKTDFGVDLACISYKTADESSVKKLLSILSFLVNDYHYIILDLPLAMGEFVFATFNQSDMIHILTSPDAADLKKTHNLIERIKKDFNFLESKIKVVVNEYKSSKINYQEQRDLLGVEIYATLPRMALRVSDRITIDEPKAEYAKAIRRISRQMGNNLVGLALGVGVGYGFCHIGVLKVIEEEHIPIDIIAGSSIGSLIACLWATGRPAEEILKITKEEFKQPKYTWGLIDLTFPFLGFVKGNKLYRFLKKYLGNKTFYDVKLPLKIIASDIRKKQPIVLDKGLLIDAVMASCSMPGVFLPFKFREGILLDGGVINPLPTEILFKLGVKKIIAVNVTPSREDILRQYEKMKQEIKATGEAIKKRKWLSVKEYFKNKFKTNIVEIVFSSIEAMQTEVIEKEAQFADIVLHPDTSGLHWLELYRAQEFAIRGEAEARKNLDKIWQVINE